MAEEGATDIPMEEEKVQVATVDNVGGDVTSTAKEETEAAQALESSSAAPPAQEMTVASSASAVEEVAPQVSTPEDTTTTTTTVAAAVETTESVPEPPTKKEEQEEISTAPPADPPPDEAAGPALPPVALTEGWTQEHHLVGHSTTLAYLRPDGGGPVPNTVPALAFWPESIPYRRPALWRHYVSSPDETSNTVMAVDYVAADMGQPDASNAGTPITTLVRSTNLVALQNRVEARLLQHIVTNVLPQLVMVAALEDVRSQYLGKVVAEKAKAAETAAGHKSSRKSNRNSGGTSTTTTTLSSPPGYYSAPPSQYLKAPTPPTNDDITIANDSSHSDGTDNPVSEFTFTPNQLVNRVKAGCALVWPKLQALRPPLPEVDDYDMVTASAAAAVPLLSNRQRTSRRLAAQLEEQQQQQQRELQQRLQQHQQKHKFHESNPDQDEQLLQYWKVTTGGSVATFLWQHYGLPQPDKEEKKDDPTEGKDEVSMEVDEDADPEDAVDDDDQDDDYAEEDDNDDASSSEEEEVDEEEEELEDEEEAEYDDSDNPYLQPTNQNIADWLGRKTAKFLSNADVQSIFPPLMYHPPKKGRKKKALADTGLDALNCMSKTDQTIWNEVVGSSVPHDARLCLESTQYEDATNVADWETPHFGRQHFCLRLVGPPAAPKKKKPIVVAPTPPSEDVEMIRFKEQKAEHTWRFKGIHGGYTVWPSWRKAAEAWRAAASTNSVGLAEGTNGPQGGDTDLELAQALAAQEDVTTTTSGRRSRRGGETGTVFYGNQSSLTLKQLMDAMLRKTSERPFATLIDLVTMMQDDSTDPVRRMRSGLGRLVYKRNQLAVHEVTTDWTDKDCLNHVTSVDSLQVAAPGDGSESEIDQSDVHRLAKYMKELLCTELWLRRMVVKHLTQLPVEIIATAADERAGTIEAIDDDDFENPEDLEWEFSGHELLGKLIFRPVETRPVDTPGQCFWFRIEEYVPSVEAPFDPTADKPNLGKAKDIKSVERRKRFKALRLLPPGKPSATLAPNENPLILTEGQVRAGIKAAQLGDALGEEKKPGENPMRGRSGSRISLVPMDAVGSPRIGIVAGHTSALSPTNTLLHKMLILFDTNAAGMGSSSAWVLLESGNDGLRCRIEGENGVVYSVQEADYDSSSDAFKECQYIIEHLQGHNKIDPFLAPVDPVALNIPTYFQVIKNPMDLSTLKQKLEKGDYSEFSLSETVGSTPIARMLNGPFRRDLELIFNNAIAFNPPDDWIHKAAITLKNFASRKIEQACQKVERFVYSKHRARQSIYVEYDSDTDMYGYDDDRDEDYDGNNRKRKRSIRTPTKEDPSLKAVERGIPLAKVMPDGETLRGPFGNFPVNTDASSFALPSNWTCHRDVPSDPTPEETVLEDPMPTEIEDLLELRAQLQDQHTAHLRRSTRAAAHELYETRSTEARRMENIVYDCDYLEKVDVPPPTDRLSVELTREHLHEEYFAKQYKSVGKLINPDSSFAAEDETRAGVGLYSVGAFPPYLGSFFPSPEEGSGQWEIRSPLVVPALRWVIRGLVESEHLGSVESLSEESTKTGVVIPNNIYFYEDALSPLEVCDQKEFSRRRKAQQEGAVDSDDDEGLELSEYEKLRQDRVKRNAERLRALGLA